MDLAKSLLLFVVLLSTHLQVHSYKILGVFPFEGKSHYIIFEDLMKQLAHRGHEVTVLSHFPQPIPIDNFKDVSLVANEDIKIRFDFEAFTKLTNLDKIMLIANNGLRSCAHLNSTVIRRFLQTQETFDVILIEQFNSDCFLGFAWHFNAPHIGITTHVLMPWANHFFGNPDNPAYVPNHFMHFSDRMTFVERFWNTVAYLITQDVGSRYVDERSYAIARNVFGESLPELGAIGRNMSLMLANTHFSLTRSRPLVPAIIEIAGIHMHAKRPRPPPENIEKWINESRDGVIYFSMGSMIKGHTFPEEKRKIFLRAFGRLKQRVLWKWENETMPDKPDNVMIQKWMPQFDILSHPNVKAFISHGGLLGTTEAVHCGVPVVVMPQFGDQHTNARALEAGGGGVVLNFREADEEMVYNALKTVLEPEFNKKAKELSARFRDRPMSPMDTAIYWIEYVARHKGAHHLRTAAVGMPLYQYLLLDVFGFLALCLLTTMFVFIFLIKMIIRLVMALFSLGDKKQKKQKKQ